MEVTGWLLRLILFITGIEIASSCTDGQFSPDPSDCNRYLLCDHGTNLVMNCPSGLYWNAGANTCDWPASSGCVPGNLPTTTTNRPQIPTTAKPTTSNPRIPTTTTRRTTTINPNPNPNPTPGTKKLICYFTDWAWYRQGPAKYTPDNIDPSLCTNIVYGFILLDSNTWTVKIADSWADIDNKFYEKVTAFKSKGIKVSVALGGWTDSAGSKYSTLVNDPAKRSTLIASAVQFIQKYNFDGIDLDWEYPKCWQGQCDAGPASDKDGFAALIRELRQALPPGSMLSAAVSASKAIIPNAYDVPTLTKLLDWIGVMDYDFHGPWDGKTGHIAPLYYTPGDTIDYFNVDSSIKVWLGLGADPAKLIVGIPLYGKSFTLASASNNGLNAPTSGPGNAGQYTGAAGTLAYYEICTNVNSGWTVVQDPQYRMGPYAYSGNQWVSYDDPVMVTKKAQYITQNGLGGAMVWALDFDDFNNICGGGNYPLLTALRKAL